MVKLPPRLTAIHHGYIVPEHSMLPADMRFDESVKKVEVRKQGNARIISPAGQSWDSFFAKPQDQWLSEDFSVAPEPPQEREGW